MVITTRGGGVSCWSLTTDRCSGLLRLTCQQIGSVVCNISTGSYRVPTDQTNKIRQNHKPLETFMKQEIVFICIYFQFPCLPPFYTNWLEGLPILKNKLSPSMYKVHYEVSQCGGILNYFYEVYLIHHTQVHIIIQVSLCEILEFRGFFNKRANLFADIMLLNIVEVFMHFWTELRGVTRVTVRGDITVFCGTFKFDNFYFNYHLKANQVNFSPFSHFPTS